MSTCLKEYIMIKLLNLIENGINLNNKAGIYIEGDLKISSRYRNIFKDVQTFNQDFNSEPIENKCLFILTRECVHIMPIIISAMQNNKSFMFGSFKNTTEYNSQLIKLIKPLFVILIYKKNKDIDSKYVEGIKEKFGDAFEKSKQIIISCNCYIEIFNYKFAPLVSILPQSIYIIQTSGTTGPPKCVYVPEACILPNILDITNLFVITHQDVILLASALTFDMGMLEIFLAMVNNATLLMVSEIAKRLPLHLINIIINNGVTILQATPSLLRLMYASAITSKPNHLAWNKMIKQLKVLAIGGESCPSLYELRQWVKELRNDKTLEIKSHKLKIFNLYGLTEQSCWSLYYEIPSYALYGQKCVGSKDIPLGEPFSNTNILVRNLPPMSNYMLSDNLAKEDILGELCVGPMGMCEESYEDIPLYQMKGPILEGFRGPRLCYNSLGHPIPNLLPTGDIVAIRQNIDRSADLYFVGRVLHELEGDSCTKRSGHRISISAIEDVARHCPDVPEYSIIYVNTLIEDEKTQIDLFLFVAHSSEESFDSEYIKIGLRQHLLANLPYYSLPDRICILSQTLLPLTSHGKLDKSKLKGLIPAQQGPEDSSLSPMDLLPVEWRFRTSASSADPLSRDASFLFLGGDSLAAISLSELLSTWTGHMIEPWIFLEDILYRNYGAVLDRLSASSLNSETHEIARRQPKRKLKLSRNLSAKIEGPIRNDQTEVVVQGHSTYRFGGEFDIENKNVPLNFQPTSGHFNNMSAWAIRILSECHVGKCLDATPLVVRDDVHVTHSGRERIYAGCHSGWFYAFERVNNNLTHFKMASGPEINNRIDWKTYLGGRIEASAAFSRRSNLIIVGSYDYNLYALDRESGVIEWIFPCAGEIKSCPAIDSLKDIAYVGCHGKQLYAIRVGSGTCIWTLTCPDGASIFSSPCLNSNATCLVFATLKGSIYGIRTNDATLLWSYTLTSKPIFSSPCSLPRGYFAFGGVDGNLYIFKPVHRDFNNENLNAKCEPFVLKTGGPFFAPLALFSKYIFAASYDGCLYTLKFDENAENEFEVVSIVRVGTADLYASPRPVLVNNEKKLEILVLVVDKEGNINLIDPLKGAILCKHAVGASTYSSPVISGSNIYIGTRDDRFVQLQLYQELDDNYK